MIKHGLLASRGYALERLARATVLVFDKTGTLTHGTLKIGRIYCQDDVEEAFCLQIAAGLESRSEHPLARAFIDLEVAGGGLPEDFMNVPGGGLTGLINGTRYYLGNAAWVAEQSGQAMTGLEKRCELPGTRIFLADDKQALALFVLHDTIRPGAAELVQSLRNQGIEIKLYSGDDESAVGPVAHELGIETWQAGMLPADKLSSVRALQHEGHTVAMVGDGINDAPVLAGADVSIAIGEGARYAAAAADMVLLAKDLDVLEVGVNTVRKMMRIIRQNLFWALTYNIAAIPLAATGFIHPWMAALGMSASSLLVVANAMRLTR